MKKVLSTVLALVMVLSTMIMLVPTASAATATDLAPGTEGKVYYEQNFDDPALANLNDAELAAALGWKAPGSQATMWIENGKVRIVTQYTPSGVYPATENKWGSGYNTGVLFEDLDLTRNALVAEYTFQYNRRAAGNDCTVTLANGSKKTVKADGQGTYQCAEFFYTSSEGAAKNAGTDDALVRINMGGDGWANTLKGVDSATDNTVYWKTTTFEKVNALPAGDTIKLEMHNNPVVTTETEAQLTSTIMNREYSVKVVIEPWAHRLYAFVDGQLFITMNIPTNTANYGKNDWGRLIADKIGLLIKPGVDVTMDNFKFYQYVPALNISEVMVNGTKANGTGKYQWIELTNPSATPVNVYDYAIHLETMANTASGTQNAYKADYTIGCETDQGTGAWYVDAASTLGYFTPGAKTLGEETFDSPAYADGVLQPGESAIVLFPQTAMAGGTPVTDEAFKEYLVGLGMDENVKTFVCDNESDYNFSIGTLTNESATLQVVKATNTATDGGYKPVADCKGQPAEYSPAFAECTVWVTSKGSGSGTAFWGMTVKEGANVPADALGSATIFGTNTDASYEIKYNGWVNKYAQQVLSFEHTNIKFGFSLYQPDDARKNAKGEDVYATPGYVPVECRRVTTATVTDIEGKSTLQVGPVGSAMSVTVATPNREGYKTQVWVNGDLYEDAVVTDTYTVTFDASEVTVTADLDVEVKEVAVDPQIIGIQKAYNEDGSYTLRILAGVNELENFESLGFYIYMESYDAEVFKEATVECLYAYEAVTKFEGGSETMITAESEGFDCFYAIHIENVIPEDATTDLVLTVAAMSAADGETDMVKSRQGDQSFDLFAAEAAE